MISPKLDAAQRAVAATSSGFVVVGPELNAPACELFSGAPHLTSAGNLEISKQLAGYYGKP